MFNTKERTRTRSSGHHHNHHVPPGGLPKPSQNRHHRQNHSKSPHEGSSVVVSGGNNSSKWGPRTSSTLPNPVIRPQAKVRVQAGAGDKCVAPAKSRQKRRQGVPGRPIDHSTLSMDAVIWSDEVYSVDQLVHAYGGKFPVIAKVMQGCHDNAGFSLVVDQVIQCHSYNKQKRVRAHTDSGGQISIPAEYPMQVFHQDGNVEERLSLSELLDRKTLPVRVLVTSVDEDIEVSTVNVVGRHLVITDVEHEIFLRTNTITDGWIDQDEIYTILACFHAKFSMAVGMRGATPDEWTDYYGMFSRSVRHLNFRLLTGYEGIIIRDDGGGSIKVELPKNPTQTRRSQGPVYENLGRSQSEKRTSATEPRPSTSRQHNAYENWDKPMSRVKSEKKSRPITVDYEPPQIMINPHEDSHSPPGNNQHVTRPRAQVSPRTKTESTGFDRPQHLPDLVNIGAHAQSGQVSPRRPETPFSDAEEDDVEEMFKSVLDVAEEQETLKRKIEKDEKMDEQELIFMKRRDEEEKRKENIRRQLEEKQLARLNNKDEDQTASARKHLQVQNAKNYTNLQMKGVEMSSVINPRVEDNRPSYRSSGSSHASADMKIGSVQAEVYKEPDPNTSSQVTTRDKGVKTLTKQFEPPGGVAVNGVNNMHGATHGPVRSDNGSTPKATVQPMVQTPHVVTINVTNTPPMAAKTSSLRAHTDINANSQRRNTGRNVRTTPTSSLSIKSMEDVPTNLDHLSTEDVCQCLSLLNMDRHLKDFKKHEIDGKLLISLKETVLTKDFQFTDFNASKLMRFIRGWRPKLA